MYTKGRVQKAKPSGARSALAQLARRPTSVLASAPVRWKSGQMTREAALQVVVAGLFLSCGAPDAAPPHVAPASSEVVLPLDPSAAPAAVASLAVPEPVAPQPIAPEVAPPATATPPELTETWLEERGVVWQPDAACWVTDTDPEAPAKHINVCACDRAIGVTAPESAAPASSGPPPPGAKTELLVCARETGGSQVVMDVERDTVIYAVGGHAMWPVLRFTSTAMSADMCSWYGSAPCAAGLVVEPAPSGIDVSEQRPACEQVIGALAKRPELGAERRLFQRICRARGSYRWSGRKLTKKP